MTFIQHDSLNSLVQEIANEYPSGLRHSEFVQKVLESGYKPQESKPLSSIVHSAIKNLVEEGFLVVSEETGSREYHPSYIEC